MEKILQQAEQMEEELIAIRRTIHQNPEVGRSLPMTKAFVMKKLREYGYEPEEICESGIVAVVTGTGSKGATPAAEEQKRKTILLRADMDALPITEEVQSAFRAENGCMHACGHDMHTAMLLGAAKLLQDNKETFSGTVKLAFQPDEEGFTGAKAMLQAGVLKNPSVDAALALHVHSGTPTGLVMGGLGTFMAGCTLFRITVRGTACHGAMPETGVDPINIAAHIYLALQELVARETAATEPVVVTIGKFTGGEVPNLIPSEVVLEGTIRTLDKNKSQEILKRIETISASMAELFRGSAVVEEIASAPPLINDTALVEKISSYIKEIVEEEKVILLERGGMGSEDFASYTYELPCAYLLLGAGSKQENEQYGMPMHNEKVVFNEEVLKLGAALYAHTAIRWLSE